MPPAAGGEEGSLHHRLRCAKQNCISSRGEPARQREGVKRPREGVGGGDAREGNLSNGARGGSFKGEV